MISRAIRLATLLLIAFASHALAQSSVTLQVMTDFLTPSDFGTGYSLGALSNDHFTYGPNFIIRVSYHLVEPSSLNISLDGSQAGYLLAWRVAGSTVDNPFSSSLGSDVTSLSGSASNLYYDNDGSLRLLSTSATRFRIGARATPDAATDLDTAVIITATLY